MDTTTPAKEMMPFRPISPCPKIAGANNLSQSWRNASPVLVSINDFVLYYFLIPIPFTFVFSQVASCL